MPSNAKESSFMENLQITIHVKISSCSNYCFTTLIVHKHTKQVKLMWTLEALSLFMINHPYLDSLNDVEIYNALKNYSRL